MWHWVENVFIRYSDHSTITNTKQKQHSSFFCIIKEEWLLDLNVIVAATSGPSRSNGNQASSVELMPYSQKWLDIWQLSKLLMSYSKGEVRVTPLDKAIRIWHPVWYLLSHHLLLSYLFRGVLSNHPIHWNETWKGSTTGRIRRRMILKTELTSNNRK